MWTCKFIDGPVAGQEVTTAEEPQVTLKIPIRAEPGLATAPPLDTVEYYLNIATLEYSVKEANLNPKCDQFEHIENLGDRIRLGFVHTKKILRIVLVDNGDNDFLMENMLRSRNIISYWKSKQYAVYV